MIRMNESDVPIAHRKRLDDKTFVDEPLYTSPDISATIPGHLNTTLHRRVGREFSFVYP